MKYSKEARALTYGSASCPACGRDIALRKDGRMRKHQAWLSHQKGRTDYVQFPPPCRGGDRTPSEVASQ